MFAFAGGKQRGKKYIYNGKWDIMDEKKNKLANIVEGRAKSDTII